MADPYTTAIPGATGYESATLAAKTAYQSALTRLNQQRGDTLRQFGYAGDIDPTTGVVNNVRVDANLPYGQYQQERGQHADQYQQARDSAQERGIGHGGLAEHTLTRLRSGFGADDAALGSSLSGSLSGFQDQQNQAKYQQDSALADAQLQATRDAIQAQMFDPANQDGLSTPDGPDWNAIIAKLLGGGGDGSSGGSPAAPYTTPGPNNAGLTRSAMNDYGTPKTKAKAAVKAKPVISSVPPDLRPKAKPKKKGG